MAYGTLEEVENAFPWIVPAATHVMLSDACGLMLDRKAVYPMEDSAPYERWLRLFGQFLSVHKWCLAACAYAAVGRAG